MYSSKYNRITTVLIYNYINHGPSIGILLIVLNKPNVSCSLANPNFLLSPTLHFGENIVFLSLQLLSFTFYIFFLFFKQEDNLVL